MSGGRIGNRKTEGRSLPRLGFAPYPAALSADQRLHVRETHSFSRHVLFPRPAEDLEDFMHILVRDPAAVILHGHEHGAGDRCVSFRYEPGFFEQILAAAGAQDDHFVVSRLPPLRERVRRRLASWQDVYLRSALGPLFAARDGAPPGAARGLAFALAEGLGFTGSVLDVSQAKPKILGKVSTAAVGFNMRSTGRGNGSDVFLEGIETRAGHVALSERLRPWEWGLRDLNPRVHKLAQDTEIRFYADGSYSWRERKSGASQYRNEGSKQPVYFIAARGETLYVKGIAAGKFLVYSPHRIVVEGSLTYAHDPRNDPDSGDYLGLVCDREIEVAPHDVTGPGDVVIDAATSTTLSGRAASLVAA